MVFTTWSFILMSAHVGLHWNMVVSAVKKRMENSKHLYQYQTIARITVLFVAVYGLYAFISRELLQRMFLMSEYAFFDYNESILLCFADYFSILLMFSYLSNYIIKLIHLGK